MRIKKYALTSAVAGSLAFAACTDANYDLSDINTLAQVKINNITVPVNVDEMVLDSLLDIKADSKIKKMKNGSYAVVVEDVIKESKEIKFDPIKVNKPSVDPITSTISKDKINFIAIPGTIKGSEEVINFAVPHESSVLDFTSTTVDNAVQGIDAVEIEEGTGNLKINIAFSNVDGIKSFYIKGLVIQLPKGLQVECDEATFNYEEGKLVFPATIKTTGLNYVANLKITGIKNNGQVDFTPGTKGVKGSQGKLSVKDDIKVVAGTIHVYGENLEGYDGSVAPLTSVAKALASDNVGYKADVTFASNLIVNVFHGDIYYEIDGISVNSVDLTDLPDALTETGTELGIDNPQLYLYINNPILQSYADTKIVNDPYAVLNITPRTVKEKGDAIKSGQVTFGVAENYIVCAPRPENVSYKSESDPSYDFSHITNRVAYPGLGNMLKFKDGKTGEFRVPDSLAIDIEEPKFDTKVKSFHLGAYGKVNGKYAFYAPVKLTPDSKVVYSDTIDIDADDLDDVNIEKLLVKATITTSAPASSIVATVYPIEKGYEGKPNKAKREKELERVITVNGDAEGNIKNSDFSLEYDLTGQEPIKALKGLVFKVKVNASGNDDLKPSQTVKIGRINITASGAYEKEL